MWWRPWPLLQPAEFGGPTLVSALLVLANLLVADSLLALRAGRAPGRAVRIGALIILGVIAAGMLRAAHVDGVRREAPTVRVGLVQPNFGVVSLAERSRKSRRHLLALRSSTAELARQGAELVVWPETSWPLVFDRALQHEYASEHPWELRSGTGVRLLFGATTHDFGTAHVYNSAILIAESGSIAGRYDKNRPIPFGEYVPFADRFPEWAARVRKRLPLFPEIRPGDHPRVLADGPLRIAPLICSEDLEVDLAHRAARGANLLVTIANDAWFGDSAAPRQHLANAVMRAVEARRDFVRATNTGVSAIVDALGRVRVEGPLFHVPEGEAMPPTLLSGEVAFVETFALGPHAAGVFPWACGAILAVAIAERWLRRERS
jgi:apolipoprotein N-acyltransferase